MTWVIPIFIRICPEALISVQAEISRTERRRAASGFEGAGTTSVRNLALTLSTRQHNRIDALWLVLNMLGQAQVMEELNRTKVERYLKSVIGEQTTVRSLAPLGASEDDREQKKCGYGTPVLVEYELATGERKSVVLHTISPSPFGHEHMSDRAQILLWQRDTFNRLPRHIHAIDAGVFQTDGTPVSLRAPEEFFLLTEYAEGAGYFLDLERIAKTGALTELDVARTDALCDYLVDIHRVPGGDGGLYRRRIRELVGHGECIFGIADSYDANGFNPVNELREIEHLCVDWRWRLKDRTHRLRQVHGDFHPWNILFRSGADITVLDRSRGEFGDPADDVACLSLNYVFFSLERSGRLEGAFETLFRRFWEGYLEKSSDLEILNVIAPFFVFRALVLANPKWYPNLAERIRRQLFAFSLAVLSESSFDPSEVNHYCRIAG